MERRFHPPTHFSRLKCSFPSFVASFCFPWLQQSQFWRKRVPSQVQRAALVCCFHRLSQNAMLSLEIESRGFLVSVSYESSRPLEGKPKFSSTSRWWSNHSRFYMKHQANMPIFQFFQLTFETNSFKDNADFIAVSSSLYIWSFVASLHLYFLWCNS